MASSEPQKLVDEANALSCSKFIEKFIRSGEQELKFATTSGAQLRIEACRSEKLSEADFTACFSLIRDTSSTAYKNSSRGWRPSAKKEEMREEDMWYLLVRPESSVEASTVSAFISFMITIEDDYPVVYVYEIHISSALRGQKLAERFYRKRGYEIDDFSPQERRLRGGKVKRPDYVILSKALQ
ncbi:hypothetical protein NA57DRAFT_32081 [Rhizodiscina lignyota]|uniref:Uncharacterized protein n=1 Tax=Rhizodiscina lignyota TaxID=1504668 RepID=A0A9P4MED6_9PEZI|nr:hypothetical protein NA57DRAFT_32081 [Rhizodiscina lignyota]